MIESVQVRQRGAFDFETHYDNLCALQDSCPLPAVKAHLSQGVLDLNGDRIRANDWMPVLNTLRINKSLEFVAIRSYYTPSADDNEKKALIERRKTPSVRSKEITYRMCKALKECLGVTPALTCLELQGLPLRERDLNTLMKGLVKNNTLSHFSLEFCRIGDAGLDSKHTPQHVREIYFKHNAVICKGIKNSASINSVNFTGCSLSWKGADSLAKVIKHQAMRRHNEAWRDSLRYRRPDLDRMPGIRRITINNNPMMGDQGATLLAEALKDDLWLKALDMQGNGISSTGAKALLDVLKYNTTLVVLDVRRNPLIDRDLVHAIMEQLMINCNGQDTEYKWIKADEPVDANKGKTPKKRTKTLNSSFGRKTTIRITAGAARRRTRSAESVGVSRKMKPISSEGVKAGPGLPWRTAARANRYRGYPPEHVPGQSSLLENSEGMSPQGTPNQSAVVVTMEGSEGEDEEEDTIGELQKLKLDDSGLSTQVNSQKNLRIEVQQLRRQIQEERLARHRAEQRVVELTLDNKKLREENSRLKRTKGSILDDDSVLESIEASFKQFHEFLDLLRDAGLGQLITMAGLDAKGSPFSQQHSTSKLDADRNTSFPKTTGKSNGYLGDIKGNNHINNSYVSSEKPVNGNLRPKSYLSSNNDPTMSSFLDDSNDALKARHDDLYERILQNSSGAFKHIGEQDVTVDITVDSTQTHEDNQLNDSDQMLANMVNKMKDKEFVDNKNLAVSESFESVRGPEGEIIMSLSPFDEEEDEKQPKTNQNGKRKENIPERVESPDKGRASRVSDFSYGMDSFEQSYVSERGEVVHLGDEMDFYPESPSPIGHESEEEEDF